MATSTVSFVSADHPSLDGELERFLGALHLEPAPRRSLPKFLRQRGGIRVAAVESSCVIGLARVDRAGELSIAVAPHRRGWGIGAALGRVTLQQAIASDYTRVVVRTSRRSWAIRRAGEQLGCTVVDLADGRTDLVLPGMRDRRSA